MVLWQISTFHHLHTSGFGRPFPRHGLQLLFWFSNHCVTFDLDVLRMVSECEPENGAYGFHRFGNLEELLPVLPRSSREITGPSETNSGAEFSSRPSLDEAPSQEYFLLTA